MRSSHSLYSRLRPNDCLRKVSLLKDDHAEPPQPLGALVTTPEEYVFVFLFMLFPSMCIWIWARLNPSQFIECMHNLRSCIEEDLMAWVQLASHRWSRVILSQTPPLHLVRSRPSTPNTQHFVNFLLSMHVSSLACRNPLYILLDVNMYMKPSLQRHVVEFLIL